MEHLTRLPFFGEIVNDDTNELGISPLLWSALNGQQNLDTVMLLMRHGLDLMQVNKMDGMSIMHICSASNDVPMLGLVLDTYQKQNKTTKDLVNLSAMTGVTPI